MHRINQRIRIVSGPWATDCGTIKGIEPGTLLVNTDSGQQRGYARVHPDDAEPIKPEQPEQGFDSGLGIGGLGQHVEEHAPTTQEIERQVIAERTTQRCSRCGASELSGAMFTTDAGSGVCDDCYS
jgi:hypothetical protein